MTTGAGDPVVVACAADRAYVKPLAAMVQSVLAHLSPERPLRLFVLAHDILADVRQRLERDWTHRDVCATWLAPPAADFAGLPLWGRMPLTTYFKLAVAELLPPDVERAIWLDCDLVVVTDLARLWATDLGGHHALAVQDQVVPFVSSRFGIANHERLGLDRRAKYFNAGVMLIDVARWRRDGVRRAVLEYLRRHRDHVYFWDQEGLNAVLAGKWGELDARWNWNASLPRRGASKRECVRSGGTGASDVWVVHYAGNLKPWLYPSRDPCRRLFFEYLDRTGWAGWRPPPSMWGRAIDVYDGSALRRALYPAEQLVMQLLRAASLRYSGPAQRKAS